MPIEPGARTAAATTSEALAQGAIIEPDQPLPASSEVSARTDEVLRRVGRNLLLFQQIELLLKDLLCRTGVAGYISELPKSLALRAREVNGKTLGQLAKQYHEEVLGSEVEAPRRPENLREIWVGSNFRIEADAAVIARDVAVLESLIDERNDLAHTFLTRWNPASEESTDKALRDLDAQRARALPVRDHLKALLTHLMSGLKEFTTYLQSEQGAKDFDLVWLQQTRLVQLLAQIAATSARPDGWTVLASAGSLVSELDQEAFSSRKERFGYSSLRRLLIASELFEVAEEPLPNNHSRTVYRLRQPALVQPESEDNQTSEGLTRAHPNSKLPQLKP